MLTLSAKGQQLARQSSFATTAQEPEPAVQSSPPSSREQIEPASVRPATMDQVVDHAIEREHALMAMLKGRTPLVETYLQNLKSDPELGPVPVQDHYFLGRMDLGEGVARRDFLSKDTSLESRLLGGFNKLYKLEYKPMGFSWMIYVDRDDFSRQTYDFNYLRREFLGDVRCFVFEVSAKHRTGNGRFRGRIWVEDQNYNIVRLNGFYEPHPRNAYFFHFDSWRFRRWIALSGTTTANNTILRQRQRRQRGNREWSAPSTRVRADMLVLEEKSTPAPSAGLTVVSAATLVCAELLTEVKCCTGT